MPRHPLLASTFSTPGRRAHGRLGAVPATDPYRNFGGFDARGLEVAAVVTTEFVERGRAPCFGKATTKMSGEDVISLFLALAFVHEEGEPDVVVVLGIHGLDHPWLHKYYGKEYAAPHRTHARTRAHRTRAPHARTRTACAHARATRAA